MGKAQAARSTWPRTEEIERESWLVFGDVILARTVVSREIRPGDRVELDSIIATLEKLGPDDHAGLSSLRRHRAKLR